MNHKINHLCNQYGFYISNIDDNMFSCALGLGDLSRLLACLKYNIIDKPLHINLGLFFVYYYNPINYIDFRLRLIKNIIDSNNIDKSKVIFYYNELIKPCKGQIGFTDYIDCKQIKNIKLNFNTKINLDNEGEEYIIFHTKARFHINKEKVVQDLKVFERFISTFKSKYKIYILGEKQIHRGNAEVLISPDIITQIYDVLINLSNNNNIEDQTINTLLDNLDYDNFEKDIQLIQNAKYNIHFGDGGSMNYSMIFGKHNTIVYNRDMEMWDKSALQKEDTFIYDNINEFLNKLQTELAATELGELKPEIRPYQKKEELNFVFNKLYNSLNKSNQNAYFLCHGGIGDLFFMNGAVRFLSLFYNKIYLFCPKSALKNLQTALCDIQVEFITYDKWYEKKDVHDNWPKVSDAWYKTTTQYLNHIYNLQEDYIFLEKSMEDLFDWQKYVAYYNDLTEIQNKKEAWNHWEYYGSKEGRFFFNIHVDINADIFISGTVFKELNMYVSQETISNYDVCQFENKITNENFLNYNQNNTWEEPYYYLIPRFYNSINLNMSIYYDYFHIPSTPLSWELYKKIKDYKIVFLHFMSSCGNSYIPDNEWPHIYNEEYLIINPDKNHYDPSVSSVKHDLANHCLNQSLVDYLDIILHATDIYVCDSSFASMIFPLRKKDLLKADNMIIYDRFYPGIPANIPKPVNLSRNK